MRICQVKQELFFPKEFPSTLLPIKAMLRPQMPSPFCQVWRVVGKHLTTAKAEVKGSPINASISIVYRHTVYKCFIKRFVKYARSLHVLEIRTAPAFRSAMPEFRVPLGLLRVCKTDLAELTPMLFTRITNPSNIASRLVITLIEGAEAHTC